MAAILEKENASLAEEERKVMEMEGAARLEKEKARLAEEERKVMEMEEAARLEEGKVDEELGFGDAATPSSRLVPMSTPQKPATLQTPPSFCSSMSRDI